MQQWIALIVLIIFSIDALVCWLAGLYPQASILTTVLIGLWILWAKRFESPVKTVDVKPGWLMGEGVEITDPDNPVRTKVVIEEHMLNKGMLVYGSPGFGKTTTFLVGFLHYLSVNKPESGWLAADGKGDQDVYAYLRATGVTPDYFFSLSTGESDTINILGSRDPDEALEIALDLLISNADHGAAAFYIEMQREWLSSTVPVLKDRENRGGPPLTLYEILAFLRDIQSTEAVLQEAIAIRDPKRVEAISDLLVWHNLEPEKRINPLKGLEQRIRGYVNAPGGKLWNDPYPSLDLVWAINNRKKIFLHLPFSEQKKRLADVLTMRLMHISNRRQMQGGGSNTLFPMLWEDWGGFMNGDWANIVSRTRSANMPASFSFQSLGQVDVVNITNQLDDSILTKFVFSVDGVDSSERCARMMGEYESIQVSVSDRTGTRYDGTNTSVVNKPRVTKNDIDNLAKGEGYLITRSSDENGGMPKRYYRVRMPMVPTQMDPHLVGWPSIEHKPSLGHGLWAEYIGRKTRCLEILARKNGAFEGDAADAEQLRHEAIWESSEPASQESQPSQQTTTHSNQAPQQAPAQESSSTAPMPLVLEEEPRGPKVLSGLDDDLTDLEDTPLARLVIEGMESGATSAKKSTAKKSTAKKTSAKKSTAKKSTAKKTTAKKSTAKKTTAKKTTAKKTTRKKAVKSEPEIIHEISFDDA